MDFYRDGTGVAFGKVAKPPGVLNCLAGQLSSPCPLQTAEPGRAADAYC